jgi:hypothetical protein
LRGLKAEEGREISFRGLKEPKYAVGAEVKKAITCVFHHTTVTGGECRKTVKTKESSLGLW